MIRKIRPKVSKLLPGQELNQMRDEHRSLVSVHKRKKDLDQAMLLSLPQLQL